MLTSWRVVIGGITVLSFFCSGIALSSEKQKNHSSKEGWTTVASRKELLPQFRYLPEGGRKGSNQFIIEGDGREGHSAKSKMSKHHGVLVSLS